MPGTAQHPVAKPCNSVVHLCVYVCIAFFAANAPLCCINPINFVRSSLARTCLLIFLIRNNKPCWLNNGKHFT